MRRPRFLSFIRTFLAGLVILPALFVFCETFYRSCLFVRARFLSGADGTFDLYAIGGSTVRGQPFDRFSFPSLVSRMFGDDLGGRKIVVHNLAADGNSIYPQWWRLKLASAYRRKTLPGAVLIYSGHNEGPLGAADRRRKPLSPGERIEREFVVRSYVLSHILYLARRARLINRWHSLDWYDFYLRESIKEGLHNGLVPLLSTAISNVAGIEPNLPNERSVSPADPAIARGLDLEGRRKFRKAIRYYGKIAMRRKDLLPYVYYRIAKCHEALGRYARARDFYWNAVDVDARNRFGRATTAQNRLIRESAAEFGVPLFDAVALFEEHSPRGLVRGNLFFDYHHPNLAGYRLLARGFAGEVSKRFGESLEAGVDTVADIRREFSIDDAGLAQAYAGSGRFVLEHACAFYPWPEDRLRLAELDFKEALRLDPNNVKAWLGLSILSGAGRTGVLSDEARLLTLFDMFRLELARNRLPELVRLLKEIESDDALIEEVKTRLGRSPQ